MNCLHIVFTSPLARNPHLAPLADDCDAFNMLVQGEDEVSSAFDGMRSVKPVEEDDDRSDEGGDNQRRCVDYDAPLPEIVAGRDEPVICMDGGNEAVNDVPTDFDAFPPCIEFEREEEIQDVGSFCE